MTRQRLQVAFIPVLTLAAAGLITLSGNASPTLFGLYLSIAAWLLGIALIVLPVLLLRRRWLAREQHLTPAPR